ncbi:transporter substrate-binding domain-containing protein [Rufibacter ruber]|uniref:transporter substrate-binding domain-containing protein n=1 Tax=Rufibacter ruber TaxID=1783499 RepID=UPI00082FF7F5|nr:transporter substrate-binding domain-containing protein [Rufibacter ruber]
MKQLKLVGLFCCLVNLSSCGQFPKDPEKTLRQVTNGTLKVGYSQNKPWVMGQMGVPTGVEAALVQGFARSVNARVQWVNDTEQNLFEKLEQQQLHLVIAGTTDDTPWKKKIAFTRPYAEVGQKKHVMGVIKGENAFVVALESFLHGQKQSIEAQWRHETHR